MRPLTFRKKPSAMVTAVQAQEPGIVMTERGPMTYVVGDWLLTTTSEPTQTWPVSQDYLDANYDLVEVEDETEDRDA